MKIIDLGWPRTVLSNLFDTAGHLVNFPPVAGPQWRGHGEHAEHEPIRGIWGRSLQRVQGQSPWSGGKGGKAPLKLKHFLLPNVQWKLQIRPFFWNLEMQKTIKHVEFCKLLLSDQSPDQNYNLCGTMAGHMKSPCGPHAARGLDSADLEVYWKPVWWAILATTGLLVI